MRTPPPTNPPSPTRSPAPRLRAVWLAAGLLWCSLAAAAEPRERWYALLLQDRPAGWLHEAVRPQGDLLVTEERLSLSVRRGEVSVTVETETRFVETAGGKPVEAEARQRLGAGEVVQRFRFLPDGVEVSGGSVPTAPRVVPLDGDWLPPEAARRYVRDRVARGDAEVRLRTLDPSAGPVVAEVSMRLVGRGSAEVFGKAVPALLWETTTSLLPGTRGREYTDEGGESLRTALELLPGLPLDVVAAERDLALARRDPPELVASTLVSPEGRLADARSARRAEYELILPADAGAVLGAGDLPSGGAQRVEARGPGRARVVVDVAFPPARGPAPGPGARRASAFVTSDDAEVRRLAAQALGPRTPAPAETAEILRRFVRSFVTRKDLSVGFATAAEVARTAQGDCTEHAVLLAALLRSRGIPSRVVSGLVHTDEFLGRRSVFAYHLWTQAWLDLGDRGAGWLDLDATLDGPAFDAGHIALSTSEMGDGDWTNDLVRLVPLLGRLRVRIVSAR